MSPPEPPVDMFDALQAIDGMVSVVSFETATPGYTLYRLEFEQPVDHGQPDGPVFSQHLSLMHRSIDAPTVLVSTGYHDYLIDRRAEPTMLFDANQLVVEHRYFENSRPTPTDWSYLDIEQAAADHHRVVEALASVYPAAWLSTGASKGGMTSIYHRRFYPDDVDATIAYVAPLSYEAPDRRYEAFFDNVGDSAGQTACRQRVRDAQRDALVRRDELLPLASTYASINGYSYERLGGLEAAFEQGVSEFEWGFWQYLGVAWCGSIPQPGAPANALFDFLNVVSTMDMTSDQLIQVFEPYFYQAATQLGYPSVPVSHLDDVLGDVGAIEPYLPVGSTTVHDQQSMTDIDTWVREQASGVVFVYGEYDPWTAGAFNPADNPDAAVFTVAQGHHGSSIVDLPPGQATALLDLLENWTGASASLAEARALAERAGPGLIDPTRFLRAR